MSMEPEQHASGSNTGEQPTAAREILATVAIRSSRNQMTDVKLYVDGEDVTDGKVTVQGSEYKHIAVKAQYQWQ